MPLPINSKRIDAIEYDAIIARAHQLGRGETALACIAAEFNRGVTTIRRITGTLGR